VDGIDDGRNTIDQWFPPAVRQPIVAQLVKRVGLTRIRAEYFVRLWVYLLVKEQGDRLKPPLKALQPPDRPVVCSLREVAELFYHDQDQGSDRTAAAAIPFGAQFQINRHLEQRQMA
jgi:hypothetical protein